MMMRRGVVFLSVLTMAVAVVLTSPTVALQTAQQPWTQWLVVVAPRERKVWTLRSIRYRRPEGRR